MLDLIKDNGVLFTFLGILAGTTLPSILGWLTSRDKNQDDAEAQLRKEIWDELRELRQKIDHLEAENEVWRSRTYKAEENLALLHQKLISRGCDKCIKFISIDVPSHAGE